MDQYFDDGGETFLPADHVSIAASSSLLMWPLCSRNSGWMIKIQIVTATLLWFILTAIDGSSAKRSDEAIDGRA